MSGLHRKAPYGWHYVNGVKLKLPHEQLVIREVAYMAVLGNTHQQIADHLTNKKILTPINNRKWTLNNIRWMLSKNKMIVEEAIKKLNT